MRKADSHIIDLIENEYFVQWVISPTEESDHYWSKWIESYPKRKMHVALARQLITSASYQIDEGMPPEDYDMVLRNIVNYSQTRKRRNGRPLSFFTKPLGIAASITLALLLSFAGIYLSGKSGDENATNLQTIIKEALPGQKLTVRLPDGSMVILNSETQLAYSLPFNANRQVQLTGEAFFDVKKNEQSPFTVIAKDIHTRVLGTSFNVKAYPDDLETAVAVVTGKVEISDYYGHQALLIPNRRGIFNAKEERLLIEPFNLEDIGWKDGWLRFKDMSVPEVIRQLERWYGVKIIIQDNSLLVGEYTGSYKNESLEEVLKGIGYTIGWSFSISDNKVFINKN